MFEINLLNDVMNGMSLLYFVLNPKITENLRPYIALFFRVEFIPSQGVLLT